MKEWGAGTVKTKSLACVVCALRLGFEIDSLARAWCVAGFIRCLAFLGLPFHGILC